MARGISSARPTFLAHHERNGASIPRHTAAWPRSKSCRPIAYCTATGTDVETDAALDPLPLVPVTVKV